jgi:hypothetical protein
MRTDLAVDVSPMAALDNRHDEITIGDLIHDANFALPDAVLVVPAEFLAPLRPRIVRQLTDPIHDALAILQLEPL